MTYGPARPCVDTSVNPLRREYLRGEELLVAEGDDGVEPGGFVGGPDSEEEADAH